MTAQRDSEPKESEPHGVGRGDESSHGTTRTVWWRGVLVFLALAGLGLLSFRADDAVENWIDGHQTKSLENLAGHISDYGDWPWLMGACVIIGGLCWWHGKREITRIILLMMLASTLAGAATNVSKWTTGRTRPNAKHVEQGFYGFRYEGKSIFGKNKFQSFPSGHTAAAVGLLAVPIFLGYRKIGGLLLLGGIVMAFARMVVEAHHFSDVCFGAWIGLLAAWIVAKQNFFSTKIAPTPGTHEIVYARRF